jgi:hypothetical protein
MTPGSLDNVIKKFNDYVQKRDYNKAVEKLCE